MLDKLEESSFPLRTGLHIEERSGMVNFSIVGLNATLGERKLYVQTRQKYTGKRYWWPQFNETFNLIARPEEKQE